MQFWADSRFTCAENVDSCVECEESIYRCQQLAEFVERAGGGIERDFARFSGWSACTGE